MLGEGVNWVANVRACGGYAVLRHGHREAVRLEEVDAARRAPILRRYLQLAPGARAHMAVNPQAPLANFEAIAKLYPVFRVHADSATRPEALSSALSITRPTPPSRDASASARTGGSAGHRKEGQRRLLYASGGTPVPSLLSDGTTCRRPRLLFVVSRPAGSEWGSGSCRVGDVRPIAATAGGQGRLGR